jgi:hypothetical protein
MIKHGCCLGLGIVGWGGGLCVYFSKARPLLTKDVNRRGGGGDLLAMPDGRCWDWPHVLQRWTRQKPPGETA